METNNNSPFGGDRGIVDSSLDGHAPEADLIDRITFDGENPEVVLKDSRHWKFEDGKLIFVLPE